MLSKNNFLYAALKEVIANDHLRIKLADGPDIIPFEIVAKVGVPATSLYG